MHDQVDERGHLGKDVQQDITLPFGQAAYLMGTLVELGSSGVYVPSVIFVDFSKDSKAPIRRLKIEIVGGVPACRELRLAARPNGRGLRPSDLEAIDLPSWIEDILAECTWRVGDAGNWVPMHGSERGRKTVAQAQRRGRRKITPELLREVADVYRTHFDDKPIEAVRDALNVEYRTAARYVQLCRSDEYGLLPKTQRGRRRI